MHSENLFPTLLSTILTDPFEINTALTSHFSDSYATLTQHLKVIRHFSWDWRTGGTIEDFRDRISHHNIPSHLSDIIWNAISSPPAASRVPSGLTTIF